MSAVAVAALAVVPAAGGERDTLDQALQRQPFHQSLKRHFPGDYEDLLARALEAGGEPEAAEGAARLVAAGFLAEHSESLREAPDAALAALLEAERTLVAAAQADMGSEACAAWLADPASADAPADGLREAYQLRAASAVDAIAAAGTAPAEREDPDVGDWERFWKDAGSDQLNRELLKKTLTADPPYPQACEVYLRFLDAIMARSGSTGERIRALWAARVSAAAAPPG